MEQESKIAFATALKVHLKIGLLSFGGPAGQIALMQQDLRPRQIQPIIRRDAPA